MQKPSSLVWITRQACRYDNRACHPALCMCLHTSAHGSLEISHPRPRSPSEGPCRGASQVGGPTTAEPGETERNDLKCKMIFLLRRDRFMCVKSVYYIPCMSDFMCTSRALRSASEALGSSAAIPRRTRRQCQRCDHWCDAICRQALQ